MTKSTFQKAQKTSRPSTPACRPAPLAQLEVVRGGFIGATEVEVA